MKMQREISQEKNSRLVGTIQNVFIDSFDEIQQAFVGRTFRDAPEIDNEVLISARQADTGLIGTCQSVRINDTSEYELYGTFDVNLI
jgi:ribosomal protein S12 methylthiotransferase